MLRMEGRSLTMTWMMMLWKTKVNKYDWLHYAIDVSCVKYPKRMLHS